MAELPPRTESSSSGWMRRTSPATRASSCAPTRLTYPNVHDGPGKVLPKYGVTGFPETYFVGRDGKLVGERVQGEISKQQLTVGIKRALAS